MKRTGVFVALACVAMAGCDSDESNQQTGDALQCTSGETGSKTATIETDFTADACLSADTVYTLAPKSDGSYVFVLPGVTVTIQPGTVIQGAPGSALIVARGGKLMAEGTAEDPIVFTSNRPEADRDGGDWGGVLILGSAPTNYEGNNQLFEALPDTVGEIGRFGGDNEDDDSGVLRYVRIEFAGFEYADGKEFNALTLCGVGRGTTVDYVQVHRGSDDGIELFGGAVDLMHIVSTLNEDDGFDTDNGWSGRAQFVIVQALNGQSSDPNGYESDNDKTRWEATPLTAPTIYNATLIGQPSSTRDHYGAVFRRGTSGYYANHIFAGFKSAAVEVRDVETVDGFDDELAVVHSIFFDNAGGENFSSAQTDFDETSLLDDTYGNREEDPELVDAWSMSAPDFSVSDASPARTDAATPPSDGFFDTSATFVGAVGDEDWTVGWTAYPAGDA